MPRFISSVAITTLLALSLPATTLPAAESPPAKGEPDIEVEVTEADLGTLVKGDTVTHDFIVENRGDAPLRLEKVQPTCGCTVAEFDPIIAPGQRGRIRAVVDTLTLTGEGRSSIIIISNDPDEPRTSVSLEYEIVTRLSSRPGHARWNVVQGEREGTITQTIWANDGQQFEVVGVETPSPEISATFRPATDDERQEGVTGPQWAVDLTLDSYAEVGAIEGRVTVLTDHPDQKRLPIPVSGFVRPTVFVEPGYGHFGRLQLSEAKKAVYRVRNFATEPITVTDVDPNVEGVQTELEAIEEGREYRIILTFDPAEMPAGPFSGTMVIETDSEKVPQLTVDLSGEMVPVTEDGADGGEEEQARAGD